MKCKHENQVMQDVSATYMGGIKGVVAKYRVHRCKDCGCIVDHFLISSEPILSEWGEQILGKRMDKSELTSSCCHPLNETKLGHRGGASGSVTSHYYASRTGEGGLWG